MLVKDLEIRSDEDGVKLLKGEKSIEVCNNTRLWQYEKIIIVTLNGYDIVLWSTKKSGPAGLYLFPGGSQKGPTIDRMNRCIPKEFKVYQYKDALFVSKSTPNGKLIKWVPFMGGRNLMTAFDEVVSEEE